MRKALTLVLFFGQIALADLSNSVSHDRYNARAVPMKEWTFLIFLNGNNNLDRFGTLNLNQMEVVGSTDQINIVAQWASYSTRRTKRVYVQKDNDKTRVTSPVIEDMGSGVDMGDWRTLVDFVKWGVEHYPAKRYFINVWDHGSGWHLRRTRGVDIHPMDISWDDLTGHYITTEQLGQALKESARLIGHKVDLYGSDACLMAMAEIADEMGDSVSYFAGSEELEPGAGWPYDELMKKWAANPQVSGNEVAKILTTEYLRSYSGGSNGTQDVTFSAYDLSHLREMKRTIADLASHLRTLKVDEKKKVQTAANQTLRFFTDDYADFGDLIKLIEQGNIQSMDSRLVSLVKAAMGKMVIANGASSAYAKATGLAIWLPRNTATFDRHINRYRGLNFDKETHWSDLVGELVRLTR